MTATATVYLIRNELKKLKRKKEIYKNKIKNFLTIASDFILQKDIRNAEKIVLKVLAKHPKNFQARLLQAEIFDYQGLHDKAMKIVNQLKNKLNGDISILAHPLAVRGYISDSKNLYAEVLKKKKQNIPESEFIIIPSWWIDRIGHFCFLDSYIKMEKLKWIKTKKKILLAPQNSISNSYLLSLYKKYLCQIVSDESKCNELMSMVEIPESIFFGAFVDDNNRSYWWISKAWEAQLAWDKKGLPPLIQMSQQDKLLCQNKLKKFGIRKNDWFVCMHSRDSAFHKDKSDPPQDYRDSNFASYEKSIQEVIRRGGWVIRLGDNTQKNVNFRNKKFVNYAFSGIKCDILDIYLASECLFFLGSNSGLSTIPALFNTPAMVVNFIPIGTEIFLKHGIFIPKLLYLENEKRFLSFHEMMKEPIGQTHDGLIIDKFLVKNNSADEIQQGVVEMFQRQGKKNLPKASNLLQEKFQKIRRQNNVSCNINIGSKFLKKYKKLL